MELPFLTQIAGQGVLGMITAISIFANWYFVRKVQEVNDKRVKDAQDFSDKLLEPVNAVKVNSELLIGLFTKFLQGNGTTN